MFGCAYFCGFSHPDSTVVVDHQDECRKNPKNGGCPHERVEFDMGYGECLDCGERRSDYNF